MSKVAIVTDSTAYLPKNLTDQYAIHVIPLTIIWDDKPFLDGVEILPEDFYKRLATSKSMPTTSQVTIAEMEKTFRELLDQDNDILGIFLSSKLSGTIQSAIQARGMLPKAAQKIAIVDSLSTTMAMGWPVLTAARAAKAGEGLEACRKAVENARDHSGVMFVVETLEFLHRGGRIGGAQALLGSALNIKPLLQMHEGQIEPVEKIRTKSKATERMVEIVVEKIQNNPPIRIATAHANAEAEAQQVLEKMKGLVQPIETLCCPLSPVIGTHAGPGTVALTYMAGVA